MSYDLNGPHQKCPYLLNTLQPNYGAFAVAERGYLPIEVSIINNPRLLGNKFVCICKLTGLFWSIL